MRIWIASFCLVAFCSSSALAQNAGAATDPKIALATKILQESHALDRVSTMWDALIPSMVGDIKTMAPSITDEQLKLVSDTILVELRGLLPDLIVANARIYANHFTMDDLRALDQFYSSPVGQKIVAEAPSIQKENIQLGLALGDKVKQDVMPKVIEKLRQQGVKI